MIRAAAALARDALQHPRTAACVLVSDDTLPLLAPVRIHAKITACPDRLLVADWEQGHGWRELCGFLDVPMPVEDFPHLNRRP